MNDSPSNADFQALTNRVTLIEARASGTDSNLDALRAETISTRDRLADVQALDAGPNAKRLAALIQHFRNKGVLNEVEAMAILHANRKTPAPETAASETDSAPVGRGRTPTL